MIDTLINKTDMNNYYLRIGLMIGLFVALMFISEYTFAKDLLAGTDSDMKDTMNGSVKHWAYWIDGGISLASFAYTKKPVVFFSVLGVSIFITLLIKLASS